MHRVLKRCLDLHRQGKIHPTPQIASVAAAEIDQHLHSLRKSERIGKAIIAIPQDLSNINGTSIPRKLSLDPEAAYLLTGGLGGLGMSLLTWFVEHGARNLVILSRSAGTTPEAQKLFTEVASLGCSVVTVTGRAQSLEDVKEAVAMAGRPIKGIVHLAMVLRVRLLALKNARSC